MRRHIQRVGDPFDVIDRYISETAFDLADVSPVQIANSAQLFLAHRQVHPEAPNILGDHSP